MRFVALAAAVASLTLCLGLELTSRQKIEQRNALVEQKRRELQPMAFEVPIDTLRRHARRERASCCIEAERRQPCRRPAEN
jgi:hypothetical protein